MCNSYLMLWRLSVQQPVRFRVLLHGDEINRKKNNHGMEKTTSTFFKTKIDMKRKNRIWIFPLIMMGLVLMLTNSCKKEHLTIPPILTTSSVTDIDGNVYTTVTIGTQVWMVENLKVTTYNDGIAIPLVTDNAAWSNRTTAGYCWYNNDTPTNKETYGALYNWYTVDAGKLCPPGWHVPSDDEWTTLVTYLGGYSVAGGKLKEAGTTHWKSPNSNATNESGFTALPGGTRFSDGTTFSEIGGLCDWWSSSEFSPGIAWLHGLYFSETGVNKVGLDKASGFSVRCLKD